MIDPFNITKFDRTPEELEEFLLFAIVVAGKTATTQAKALERFLAFKRCDESPFDYVARLSKAWDLDRAVRESHLGQYRRIVGAFDAIARQRRYFPADWSSQLHTVQTTDLENIPGIGPKTSRFFILHTQECAKAACLDTHVLKFLAAMNIKDVPKVTPQNMKEYRRLEGEFLAICRTLDVHPAKFDLAVWTYYANGQRRAA